MQGQTAICPHCSDETTLTLGPATRFFLWENEQQAGPFARKALLEMLAEGQITNDTLLAPEDGSVGWTRAGDLLATGANPPDAEDGSSAIEVNSGFTFYCPKPHNTDAFVELVLSSGAKLRVKAIRLYDEPSLKKAIATRAAALEDYQGLSMGTESIGSIGWAMAAAPDSNAVDAKRSNAAATDADARLSETISLELELRAKVHLFPVSLIENIQHPLPNLWRVTGRGRMLSPTESEPEWIETAFLHNNDEFIAVQTPQDTVLSIRWSSVEIYAYRPQGDSAEGASGR